MFKSHPHKFLYLLISLLLFALVFPVLEELGRGRIIFAIFYSATLLAAAYAVSESRGYFLLALSLAAPALATRWICNFVGGPWLQFLANVLSVLFLLLVATLILSHVLRAERVSREKIFGALSVYLLIGVIWSLLFFIVDFLVPGSFQSAQDRAFTGAQMIYYSFVTLTTLGYGDIIPISPSARALATVEALTGQIYLTVLIARLVGLHITHSSQQDGPKDEENMK